MIRDAYIRMRTIDQTIPDDVLDFMRDASLEKLKESPSIEQLEDQLWTNKKPKADKECLLLTATFISQQWEYTLFQIKKINFDGQWYWGLCNGDGDEWGDYSDLKADKYLVMETIK